LIRPFPLGSPFGPTFGCSISKAPPFRLWLIPLELCLKAISAPPWLKNGPGVDADPPGSRCAAFHERAIRRHGPKFNRACSIFR
jgi:hypothetical protein